MREAGRGHLHERMAADEREPDEQEPARSSRRRLSPSSQIGRMRATGGTPESRRPSGETSGDGEEWEAPREEDEPVEPVDEEPAP